jgi:hypothetical protein
MGGAIGGSLPLAIGVALSPIPIIAVVLMLTTPSARVNGPAFVIGWLAELAGSRWPSTSRWDHARRRCWRA